MVHTWRFFRSGGFDQVRLESGADLVALPDLDQKLWVALACPVAGLEFDRRTLELIDSDGDGRIRAPEITAAVRFATSLLKDPELLTKGLPALPLDAIQTGSAEGQQMLGLARRVLAGLGKAESREIGLADVEAAGKVLAESRFNGDGILPAGSAGDEALARAIEEAVECLGGETDRGGQPGITKARLETFFADLQSHAEWHAKGEADRGRTLPLGDVTAAAFAAVEAVRVKVDDFFTRCQLAAYDARAGARLNVAEAAYDALGGRDLGPDSAEVCALPLAHVEAGRDLPLGPGVNPAFAAAIARLRTDAVAPLLGEREALSATDWASLREKLAPHAEWTAAKAGAAVEKLGIARVRELLGSDVRARLEALLSEEEAVKGEADAIVALEKLVRLERDLFAFLNNVVSFRDFYTRRGPAIFQAGTLYVDGRSLDLCLKVADAGKHAAVASLSRTFLLYCDCLRPASGERMTIAAAVTAGDVGNLTAGRNGVFYDRQGRDWDASVVKVVENPISLRQAAFAPYRRAARFVGEQVEKFAASKDKAVTDQAAASVSVAAQKAEAVKPAAAPAAPFDIGRFAGIFAAFGLALGALGTAAASLLTGLLSLPWWQQPIALLGLFLAISGPSMLLAGLKLRQRSLGPLLDANGWAVNAHARINLAFGRSLTRLAQLPEGARRELADPFQDRGNPWPGLLLALALLLAGGWLIGRNVLGWW